MMSVSLKIAVAESSQIIRSGLLAVLKRLPGLNVSVVEIADPEQLVKSLCWQKPDILIVNPALPGPFSLQRIRHESGCETMKCVALQCALADALSLRIYDETISLYDTAEQIRLKLSRLANRDEKPESRRDLLSPREKDVVVCVVKGMTNKQIAERLCLSAHTVITHRRNIAGKLQIHSPAGLTIYAIVNKLVELDEIGETVAAG